MTRLFDRIPTFLFPVALLLATLLALVPAARQRFWEPHPHVSEPPSQVTLVVRALRKQAAHSNLIICVIDAARADHLSGYGYPRATTPILDALAQDSVVFRSHFTQYPSTKPSTASLFSGQQADTHLAYQQQPLSPETFTLAEGLARAGFRTALFSSNPNASPSMGIGLDFQETFDQNDVAPLVGHWQKFTLPDPLLTLFKKWVKLHRGERFFAYVHFDPPHQPYLQPEEMTALFAGQKPPGFSPGPYQFPVGDRETLKKSSHPALPEWINLYDANLRYADWAVGELVQTLREQRLLENTVLLVTSDHGEAFGEHGYIWHERGVYDELLRIPLLLRLPAGAPQREVTELTQTIDILPTVFDLFRVSYPAGQAQGKSLLPLLAGQESPLHEYIISRSDGNPPSYLVRSKDWAYMLWGNGTWRALYDLQRDPAQRKNVAGDHPQVANEMLKHFRSFAETQRRKPLEFLSPSAVPAPTTPSTNTHKLSAEERKRLETLGYLK